MASELSMSDASYLDMDEISTFGSSAFGDSLRESVNSREQRYQHDSDDDDDSVASDFQDNDFDALVGEFFWYLRGRDKKSYRSTPVRVQKVSTPTPVKAPYSASNGRVLSPRNGRPTSGGVLSPRNGNAPEKYGQLEVLSVLSVPQKRPNEELFEFNGADDKAPLDVQVPSQDENANIPNAEPTSKKTMKPVGNTHDDASTSPEGTNTSVGNHNATKEEDQYAWAYEIWRKKGLMGRKQGTPQKRPAVTKTVTTAPMDTSPLQPEVSVPDASSPSDQGETAQLDPADVLPSYGIWRKKKGLMGKTQGTPQNTSTAPKTIATPPIDTSALQSEQSSDVKVLQESPTLSVPGTSFSPVGAPPAQDATDQLNPEDMLPSQHTSATTEMTEAPQPEPPHEATTIHHVSNESPTMSAQNYVSESIESQSPPRVNTPASASPVMPETLQSEPQESPTPASMDESSSSTEHSQTSFLPPSLPNGSKEPQQYTEVDEIMAARSPQSSTVSTPEKSSPSAGTHSATKSPSEPDKQAETLLAQPSNTHASPPDMWWTISNDSSVLSSVAPPTYVEGDTRSERQHDESAGTTPPRERPLGESDGTTPLHHKQDAPGTIMSSNGSPSPRHSNTHIDFASPHPQRGINFSSSPSRQTDASFETPPTVLSTARKKATSREFANILGQWKKKFDTPTGHVMSPTMTPSRRTMRTPPTIAIPKSSCTCFMFTDKDGLVDFFLPKLTMACHACGKTGEPLISIEDDPTSLKYILRPWQVEFMASCNIYKGEDLVKECHCKVGSLAGAMRKWRKERGLVPSVKTISCGMALHIWSRTCKFYVRSVRKQLLAGCTEVKLPTLLEAMSKYLDHKPVRILGSRSSSRRRSRRPSLLSLSESSDSHSIEL